MMLYDVASTSTCTSDFVSACQSGHMLVPCMSG